MSRPSSSEPDYLPAYEVLPFPARIGLVADTHLDRPRPLPAALVEGLSGCDLIFHAGDISRAWVLDEFKAIAPVYAVLGNDDDSDVSLMRMLKRERFFQSGPHRIGLIHGHSFHGASRITARVHAFDRMRGLVDWVVYGHSHRPLVEERDGIWMINPGSPTQPRWALTPTWGILDVADEIRARIIEL